jgi:hypothetical protein
LKGGYEPVATEGSKGRAWGLLMHNELRGQVVTIAIGSCSFRSTFEVVVGFFEGLVFEVLYRSEVPHCKSRDIP